MKITVITVCLNSVDTIEKAIKSVINQNYENKEYIIVDGGSTDGTLEVIKKYDQYINKWISETDQGIFDAMNKGIEMSTGDVIAFLNSDDWYSDDIFSDVCEMFLHIPCDAVCGDNYVITKDGYQVYYDTSNIAIEDMYKRMIYYHSAIFARKGLFEKRNNFDLRYKIAADYDWFLKAIIKGAKTAHLHKPIFTFCYGGVSSVNEIECAREAREIAILHLPEDKKKYIENIDNRYYEIVLNSSDQKCIYNRIKKNINDKNSVVIWGAGVRGKKCLEWLQGAGIQVETIIDINNSIWGETINGVIIRSPQYLDNKTCNVIISPVKYVEEIKTELHLICGVFTCIPLIELI